MLNCNCLLSDLWGFPGSSVVKNLPANAGDASSIPGWGRSPGGGNGNLLQYSCLENLLDRGSWRATVHRVTKSWTWLITHEHTHRDRNFMRGEPCSAFPGNWDWEVVLMVPLMEMHKAPCSYEPARPKPWKQPRPSLRFSCGWIFTSKLMLLITGLTAGVPDISTVPFERHLGDVCSDFQHIFGLQKCYAGFAEICVQDCLLQQYLL